MDTNKNTNKVRAALAAIALAVVLGASACQPSYSTPVRTGGDGERCHLVYEWRDGKRVNTGCVPY